MQPYNELIVIYLILAHVKIEKPIFDIKYKVITIFQSKF